MECPKIPLPAAYTSLASTLREPYGNLMQSQSEPSLLQQVREAFIKSEPRPTQKELSQRFHVPEGTVAAWSAQGSWPVLRNEYLEAQLREADAKSALLAVVKGDHVVSRRYLSFAISTLEKLEQTVARVDEEKAPSSNAQTLNTCCFAAANLAKSLHDVGIVGVSKILKDAGKEDNGRWNPQMLHQLNVTVQNITKEAEAQRAAKPKAEVIEPD